MPTQTTDPVAPPEVTPVTTPTPELTQDQKYANYRAGLIQQIKDAKSATPVAPATTPAPTPTTVQPDQNTMDGGKPVWTVPEATVVPTVPTPTNPVPEQPTPTPTTPTPISTTEPVQAQPQSFDEAFKILQSGWQLADTRNNSLFKSLYTNYNQYSNLDNKTLGNYIATWKVWPTFTNLLARFNPSKYAEAMKVANDTTAVQDINTNAQNLHSVASGEAPTVIRTSDTMLQDLVSSIDNTPDTYKDIVAQAYAEHPEIKAQGDKIAKLDDQIDNIDQQIATTYEQYRTKYPDVPEAMLMGMVNRATYWLTQERNGLVRENKLLYAQYQEAKDQIDKWIQYDIAQQDKLDQRRFEINKMLYEGKRQDELRTEDFLRAEQNIEKQWWHDKDMANELKLTNLQNAISSLGETPTGTDYQSLLKQYASASAAKIKRDQAESDNKNWLSIEYTNPDTGEKVQGYKNAVTGRVISGQELSNYTGGVNQNSIIQYSVNKRKTDLLQCGQLANDYWEKQTGNSLGAADSYESKVKAINDAGKSSVPVVWGIFAFPATTVYGNTWHIGIVTGINQDWSITVLEANRENRKEWSTPKQWTYTPEQMKKMIFSQAPQKQPWPNQWFIDTILGSGKFTKDQTKIIQNAINNWQDPVTVIKNQAKNIMSSPEATSLTKTETARNAFLDLGKNLQDFYDNGGKTSYIKGNFQDVINNLGEVTDPKLVNLATQIKANLQIYRNAISGTAYSEQEGKDIASIFPWINKSKELNKAIIEGRNTVFNSVIDSMYRTVLWKQYDELKKMEWIQENQSQQFTPDEENIIRAIYKKDPNASDEDIATAIAYYRNK